MDAITKEKLIIPNVHKDMVLTTNDWGCVIKRTQYEYIVYHPDGIGESKFIRTTIKKMPDKLADHEALLWLLQEYFDFYGSKHDPERLRIVREAHD